MSIWAWLFGSKKKRHPTKPELLAEPTKSSGLTTRAQRKAERRANQKRLREEAEKRRPVEEEPRKAGQKAHSPIGQTTSEVNSPRSGRPKLKDRDDYPSIETRSAEEALSFLRERVLPVIPVLSETDAKKEQQQSAMALTVGEIQPILRRIVNQVASRGDLRHFQVEVEAFETHARAKIRAFFTYGGGDAATVWRTETGLLLYSDLMHDATIMPGVKKRSVSVSRSFNDFTAEFTCRSCKRSFGNLRISSMLFVTRSIGYYCANCSGMICTECQLKALDAYLEREKITHFAFPGATLPLDEAKGHLKGCCLRCECVMKSVGLP